jgi:hypothetical protein
MTIKLRNKNIEKMDQDYLYHLALDSGTHDLQKMFGDVKVSFCLSSFLDHLTRRIYSLSAWEALPSGWKTLRIL